jgi:hypothetical protein
MGSRTRARLPRPAEPGPLGRTAGTVKATLAAPPGAT